jgi:hypothetical protein
MSEIKRGRSDNPYGGLIDLLPSKVKDKFQIENSLRKRGFTEETIRETINSDAKLKELYLSLPIRNDRTYPEYKALVYETDQDDE